MNKAFDTYILCGGLGTRLKEVSGDKPKPLVQINGEVLLDIILNRVSEQKCINKIGLLTYYRHQDFRKYYADKLFNGKEVNVLVQRNIQGTGGAVLESCVDHETQHVLIMNGDTIIDLRFLDNITEIDLQLGNLLFCTFMHETKDYGIIEFDDEHNLISINNAAAVNSQNGGFVNTGVALFSSSMLANINVNSGRLHLESDIIEENIDKFKVKIIDEPFLDVGTPERFASAKNYIRENY